MNWIPHLVGMVILTFILIMAVRILMYIAVFIAAFMVICVLWVLGYFIIKLQAFLRR